MPKPPKPAPGELHTVDPDFTDPGLPELTVAEQRKFLAVLDALVARHEFYAEAIMETKTDDATGKYLRGQHREFVRRMRVCQWLHKIIGRMTPKEHREIAEREGALTD